MTEELKWYVVRAISGKEKKVKQYLEAEINRLGINHLVPQILIPTEKVFQIRNGKKIQKERSYLPGYVLMEASLNGELEHVIKNITGVIGFLGQAGQAVPLRQSEVNRILGKVDEAEQHEEAPSMSFIRGETVKVVDGPFSGFIGVVEEVFDEKKKLNVVVKIFGRNTPVELSYAQVEKDS